MSKDEYDGFYFLPGDEEGDLNIAYFKFKADGDFAGEPVKESSIGSTYHIAFFTRDENGDPVFDENFEAVFADPNVYIEQLVGSNLYGCVLRKTEKSEKWWDEYLTRAKKTCTIKKLVRVTGKVLEKKLLDQ